MCSETDPLWYEFGSSGSTSTKQLKKLAVYAGRWRQNATKHLFRRAVNDHTDSSRHLAACWLAATDVLISISLIRQRLLYRRKRTSVLLYRISLMANHRRLRLPWAHEQKAWKADLYQVIFSNELCFCLWDHHGHVRVRRYACQRCLPESDIQRIVAENSELSLGCDFVSWTIQFAMNWG